MDYTGNIPISQTKNTFFTSIFILCGKYVTSPKIVLKTENHTYNRKSYLKPKIILIIENHTYNRKSYL